MPQISDAVRELNHLVTLHCDFTSSKTDEITRNQTLHNHSNVATDSSSSKKQNPWTTNDLEIRNLKRTALTTNPHHKCEHSPALFPPLLPPYHFHPTRLQSDLRISITRKFTIHSKRYLKKRNRERQLTIISRQLLCHKFTICMIFNDCY